MNCPKCRRLLISIDYYGELLVGCIACNRWGRPGDKTLVMELLEADIEELDTRRLSLLLLQENPSSGFASWEKNNDQVDRSCCFCFSRGNVGAGHVARAASSVGRHDHASPPGMRCRLSHG